MNVERVAVEAVPERPRRPKPALTTIEGTAPPPAELDLTPPEPPIEVERAKIAAAHEQFKAYSQQLAVREQRLTQREATLNRAAAMYGVAAKMLSVRFLLGLTLIAAFVLSLYAMQWQSNAGLFVLVAWCVLAIAPLVALEWNTRRSRQPPPEA